MNWFKVDINELLFPGCADSELIARLRIRALCAQYEQLPPIFTTKNDYNIDPLNELEFIQADINSVKTHRKTARTHYTSKKSEDRPEDRPDSKTDSHSDGADYIILDNIILDNIKEKVNQKEKENTPPIFPQQVGEVDDQKTNLESNQKKKPASKGKQINYTTEFLDLWSQYPAERRDKKQWCQELFSKITNNGHSAGDIVVALKNYKSSERYTNGFIQLSSRWFKDWDTWLEYDSEKAYDERMGYRNLNAVEPEDA